MDPALLADVITTVWEQADAAGSYLFETAREDGAVAVAGSFEVAAA